MAMKGVGVDKEGYIGILVHYRAVDVAVLQPYTLYSSSAK